MLQRHQQSMSRLFGKHWQSGARKGPSVEYFPFYYSGTIFGNNILFDPVYGAQLNNTKYQGYCNFPRYNTSNVRFGEYFPFAIYYADVKTSFGGVDFPDLSAHEWFNDTYDIFCFKKPATITFRKSGYSFTKEFYFFCIKSTNIKDDGTGHYTPREIRSKVFSPSCKWLVTKNPEINFKVSNIKSNVNSILAETNLDVNLIYGERVFQQSYLKGNSTLYKLEAPLQIPDVKTFDLECSSKLPFPSVFPQDIRTPIGAIGRALTVRVRFTTTPDVYYMDDFRSDDSTGLNHYIGVECPELDFYANLTNGPFSVEYGTHFDCDLYPDGKTGTISEISDFNGPVSPYDG